MHRQRQTIYTPTHKHPQTCVTTPTIKRTLSPPLPNSSIRVVRVADVNAPPSVDERRQTARKRNNHRIELIFVQYAEKHSYFQKEWHHVELLKCSHSGEMCSFRLRTFSKCTNTFNTNCVRLLTNIKKCSACLINIHVSAPPRLLCVCCAFAQPNT